MQRKLKKNMCDCFCSWSGGKDSCLALYEAKQSGYIIKSLLTICIETGDRTRSHGLALDILRAQASSLGIPFMLQQASWEDYRNNFIAKLREIKSLDPSVNFGIFGDIDIEANRRWEQEVCKEAGLNAYLPLWKMERRVVLEQFVSNGFTAIIVAVDAAKLSPKFLGRSIDWKLIEEFEKLNIDACGENGEYHTVVIKGPIFQKPLNLRKKGEPLLRAGYYFQDFVLGP